MNFDFKAPQWSENVIIADGDYVDRVAFNLIVNFERMIGRRIPNADMARWLDCIALDGGLREGAGSSTAKPSATTSANSSSVPSRPRHPQTRPDSS